MLPAVTLRRLPFVQLPILLFAALPLVALVARDEPMFPPLETGVGTLRVGERSVPLEYVNTAAGALVALQPLTTHLGGSLEVGPMREYHRLDLGDAAFRMPSVAVIQGVYGLFTGMLSGAVWMLCGILIERINTHENPSIAHYGTFAAALALSILLILIAAYGPADALHKLG